MAVICLLHGAWHDAWCWTPLAERLRELGHTTLAPELPFDDLSADFEDRIRPAVEALDQSGEPAVVVAHSMASTYAPLLAARANVSLTVHLCGRLGFLEAPPDAPQPFRSGVPFPAEEPDGTTAWDAQVATETLYAHLSPATAHELARRLRPLAPPAGDYPACDRSAWVALVYTAEDEIFEPSWQRRMAAQLDTEPIELPGGHFPMLERPLDLAPILDRLARLG